MKLWVLTILLILPALSSCGAEVYEVLPLDRDAPSQLIVAQAETQQTYTL